LSDKFWVVGLPRSRTYWLAEFLGCLHEGLFHYPNYNDFMDSDQVGDSTTAYLQIRDFIINERKVVIHRDMEEVKTSLFDLFGYIDMPFLQEQEELLGVEDGLHVKFEDIDERIVEIWHYCHPDIVFPSEKYDDMKDIKLENLLLIEESKVMLGQIREAEQCLNHLNDYPLQ